jgi:hypothetical protein
MKQKKIELNSTLQQLEKMKEANIAAKLTIENAKSTSRQQEQEIADLKAQRHELEKLNKVNDDNLSQKLEKES